MTQELITELREWRIASAPYEPEYKVPPSDLHLKAAAALERMVTELETANRNMTYCCYCGGKVEEEIK